MGAIKTSKGDKHKLRIAPDPGTHQDRERNGFKNTEDLGRYVTRSR